MTVKISIVSLTMAVSCAMAVTLPLIPEGSNYPTVGPGGTTYPPTSYDPENSIYSTLNDYPEDSLNYNQFQKDLDALYYATYQLMLKARGLIDYQEKYNRCPKVYGNIYGKKLAAYKAALNDLSDAYRKLKNDFLFYDSDITILPYPTYPPSPYDPLHSTYNQDPTLSQFSEDPTSLTSDSF